MPDSQGTLGGALLKFEFQLKNGRFFDAYDIPSPDTFFMLFDLLLVLAFAGGWIYTLIINQWVLADNPILRAFAANNICVGVDHGGARIAANVAWGLMLLPLACYLWTSYLQMKLWDAKDQKKFDIALMVIAYVLLMTFGLCFGIEPSFDDHEFLGLEGKDKTKYLKKSVFTIKVHTWGFCLALVGYALTRLVEIRSFMGGHKTKGKTWLTMRKGMRNYVRVMYVHFFWCAGGVVPLFKTLVFDDLSVWVEKDPEKDLKKLWLAPMSVVMWIWSLGILALPFITFHFSNQANEAGSFPMQAIDRTILFEGEGTAMYSRQSLP